MKMYRFKDNDGHREELEIPAERARKGPGAEQGAGRDGRRTRRGAHGALLRQRHAHAGRHPSGLKIGVSKREVMPIFCTSGKRDIGTKRLMDSSSTWHPVRRKLRAFLSTEGEEIAADETAPAVAFVFKSQVEQHIGEITYFRVIRGRIAEGAELVNTRTGNKEKISQLFAVARQKNRDQGHGTRGRRHRLHGEAEGHPDQRHAFGSFGTRQHRAHRLPEPLPRRHQMQGPGRRGETGQGAQRR